MEFANKAPVLALKNICKSFTGVRALHKVDFELRPGEVHALLGENGAGKSTLIKVITGAYSLDAGSIFLSDKAISPGSPADAQALGISTVYQEVNLLPNLSVAHNLFLGREPYRFGCIHWKKIFRDAQELLKRFQLDIDVKQSLSSYSVAIQQLVAIARGVDCSAKVLVLDEPTASLDAKEVQVLFDILLQLKREGMGIIFVTHFLDQVYAISDRISVLRNGENVGTFDTATLPREQLIAHMLGKELQEVEHRQNEAATQNIESPGDSAIKVENLAAKNGVYSISFSAKAGETLGLSGLLGAGRTEVCEALFGLAEKTAGSIRVASDSTGKDNADKGNANKDCANIKKPADAIKLGLALCPEDRKAEGIIGPLSIRENIVIALQARKRWWQTISLNEQQQIAQQAIKDLGIATPNAEKAVAELSGGNQQKVILARWLCTQPRILILDEPTRGIDIGAHAEIISLIRSLCKKGMTVIVASSEIDELVAFSDKVLVMRDKTNIAELHGKDISEQTIVAAIAQAT